MSDLFFIIFVCFMVSVFVIVIGAVAIDKIFKLTAKKEKKQDFLIDSADEENSSPEFEKVYQKEIVPKLQELENYRLSVIDNYKLKLADNYKRENIFVVSIIIGMLISALGVIMLCFTSGAVFGKIIFFLIGMVIIGIGTFLYIKDDKIKKDFREKTKEELFKPILAFFGNLELIKKETITLKEIRKLGLYKGSQGKTDDDIIVGTYKNVPVELVESKLTLKNHGEDDSYDAQTDNNFKGLIFKCRINKKFCCRVAAGAHAYNVDDKMKIVTLEDTEFNNKFPIYSDNQIEARYLITPSFMERIKNIEDVFTTKHVEFAFNEEYFYLFINYVITNECGAYGLFEVGEIEKTLLNKKIFISVYKQLSSIFSLIDYFKLNENTGL